MASSTQAADGTVVALWRYPVKSMLGEELNATEITAQGLLGDRAYALVDRADGKVASAKNPRKWPSLFDFRAALADSPRAAALPPVRITLPDGTTVTSAQDDVAAVLSRTLGRQVTLDAMVPGQAGTPAAAASPPREAEEYWPDMDGLDYRDTVTDFALPEGTFFDGAVVHLLTTATLARLDELYPAGRFETRRFRPNIVVAPGDGVTGFVENAWIGHTVAIGEQVRLSITGACPRCVMTTLPQSDLPRDAGILRTAAQHNQAGVGVYAAVLQGGTVRRGDGLRVE